MEKKFNREEVLDALNKKVKDAKCPTCGNNNFSLIDGFLKHDIESVMDGNIRIRGNRFIPSVATICTNCGYISFHAIVLLGLIPIKKEN